MKYFSLHGCFSLFYFLHVISGVLCTDNVYEQISSYVQDSEYVDPSSLYYDRQSQTVKAPKMHHLSHGHSHENEIVVRSTDDHYRHCEDRSYQVFARRIINILISKANLKIENGMAIGQLDIEATVEELELLRSFGEGYCSIRKVDAIIANAIRAPQISLFDEAMNFTDKIAIYFYQHRIIFASILLIIFVTIIALKVRWTRLRIMVLLFDIIITISFMLTWWELLQEAEIKLAAQQRVYSAIPDECRQNEIGFLNSVWLFFGFGKGDCLKHLEAVMTDPNLKVMPLHAFSVMATKFFFHPLAMAGHYLSDFIENITRPLPFPVNHIAKLLLVLFMPCILATLLFVSIGGSMGIRLGPFLHLYLHGRQSATPPESLANSDRQAIEILRSEIREVSSTLAEVKPALTDKKNSPQKVKETVQSAKVETKKADKPEQDSDTNSDECPETREFEKISKEKLEDEMNELSDRKLNKIEKLEVENQQNKTQTEVKSKSSLDIVKKDRIL
ncbi:uncharacterized protein LOC100679587 [Nasonia vitripennis]|uniref:Chloride channel CLIC-like protein 1 n=1 Tax=Nasonia vitripennis TaxID=7425 RepID=A0A7M7M854_NASVI|nr:uncharacterized protein LOC100679587 [Nasonia vitripennis]